MQAKEGFKRLKPVTREGYVQAKGRLQSWSADGQELGEGKGWRPEGLVEAAAEGLRGFKGLKAGKRQARMP